MSYWHGGLALVEASSLIACCGAFLRRQADACDQAAARAVTRVTIMEDIKGFEVLKEESRVVPLFL
jgi:hypothetical protein